MRKITVYVDVLFLINFSMDVITLYFTGRMLHKPVKKKRLCLSAVFGGIAATAETVFVDSSSPLGNTALVISGVILSAVMMLTAFGGYDSVKNLLRDSIVLWGAGALLGGIMTYLLSLGEPVFVKSSRTALFSAAFALCFLISYIITRIFSSVRQKKQVQVTVETAGVSVSFNALCDSGNLAREPISGLAVVIISRSACGELGRMLDENDPRLRIRAVPISTLGGERILMGFIPDRLTVGGYEREAVIAVDGGGASYGGCGGIVPSCISNERLIKRRDKNNASGITG